MKKYLIFPSLAAIVIVSVVVVAVVAGISFSARAQAPVPPTPIVPADLTGWAWSSNIGWISINCINTSSCSKSDHKVHIDTAGNLTGWAWSNSIGWIKFGGLAGNTVAGMTTTNAKVDLTTGKVSGWIRACKGTLSGDCSSMTGRYDGWDGWIELSGANHASPTADGSGGVTMVVSGADKGKFRGFAWGGIVVGWVNFDPNIRFVNGKPEVPTPTNPPGTPPGTPLIPGVQIPPTTGGIPLVAECVYPSDDVTISAQFKLSVTAKASGGTGPYTYDWSNDSATYPGTWSNVPTATLSYTPATTAKTYTPSVRVKDANGTVSTASCKGSVEVPAVATNPIELWFPKLGRPIEYSTIPTLQIKKGENAVVNYFWKTAGLTCSGEVLMAQSPESDWRQTQNSKDWQKVQTLATGAFTFTQLPRGVFEYRLACTPSDGSETQYSNKVRVLSQVSSLIEI